MQPMEHVYNVMKDIKNKTPILLLGSAGIMFKKMYRGPIIRIDNTEEAKELITNYSNVEYDKPLVIEDIGSLYRDSILLKLIEEIKIPLILISLKDNLSIPLYSRMKTILKYPLDMNVECNFIDKKTAIQYINQENLEGYELDKYLAENCPELLFDYIRIKKCKNKDKLLQILGGL